MDCRHRFQAIQISDTQIPMVHSSRLPTCGWVRSPTACLTQQPLVSTAKGISVTQFPRPPILSGRRPIRLHQMRPFGIAMQLIHWIYSTRGIATWVPHGFKDRTQRAITFTLRHLNPDRACSHRAAFRLLPRAITQAEFKSCGAMVQSRSWDKQLILRYGVPLVHATKAKCFRLGRLINAKYHKPLSNIRLEPSCCFAFAVRMCASDRSHVRCQEGKGVSAVDAR